MAYLNEDCARGKDLEMVHAHHNVEPCKDRCDIRDDCYGFVYDRRTSSCFLKSFHCENSPTHHPLTDSYVNKGEMHFHAD